MRLGIRLQILLALGAVLLVAFALLYFAVAGLARATLVGVRESTARALGRAVAGHVASEASNPSAELGSVLEAQLSADTVVAVGLYGASGERVGAAALPGAGGALPMATDAQIDRIEQASTSRGSALVVAVGVPRAPRGVAEVVVVVRTDPSSTPTSALARLFGLYTALTGAALLLLSYWVLTRLVVKPIDVLCRQAARVAGGARKVEFAPGGAQELTELGESLGSMMRKLSDEETLLQSRVAELDAATKELRSAQARLVRSERLASVGRLSAGLAHEVGNPLAAVSGLLELLSLGELDEAEQRDFIERARRETDRISGILRKLLDFSRPTSRGDEAALDARGDLAAALRDARALVEPQRSMRDVRLEVRADELVPPVRVATSEVVQVLLNLVWNAADAIQKEGRIEVSVEVGSEAVVLTVDDDGPGVPETVAASLFEPFVTTKEPGQGTGLGLAVCRGIVEGAGGSIAYARSPLGGARFAVSLPRADVPPRAAPSSRRPTP